MTMSLPEVSLPVAERQVKVAYQGNPGSYSEVAALHVAPNATVHGYPTFHEVIAAVSQGKAELGVLPIENSLMGSILQSLDLLVETDLHVIREMTVHISHVLMALPGVALGDIKKVYSQQPALDQCTGFIRKYNLTPVAAYDTAGSAQDLVTSGARDSAVIASARAAELNGLEILARNIEDESFNYTRFLVLSHREAQPSGELHKTSLVFAVRHTPGALLETLGQLGGLNLSSIVSRPRKDRAWSYLIHVDIDGKADDPVVASALGNVLRKASFIKILGSYPISDQILES